MAGIDKNKIKAVVIGGSAGAIDVLTRLFPEIPAGFPVPIMIVIHLPADKKSIVAQLLDEKSAVTVKEVSDKETVKAGSAYVAPPDYHMLAERDGTLSLSVEEPVLYSRPSIDVLFETAADAYGDGLLGVILSGANEDGAKGAKKIVQKGGAVIVQSPDEAQSKMMPKSAIRTVPNSHVKTMDEMIALFKAF